MSDMTTIQDWERLHTETDMAFAGFLLYRDMGPGRTIWGAADKHGRNRKVFEKWSAKYAWRRRAASYDRHILHLELEERRKLLVGEAKKWVERHVDLRDKEWKMAMDLLARAEQMLKFPLTAQRVRVEHYTLEEVKALLAAGKLPERAVTEIQPVKFNFDTAGRYLELASKLMRLAAGEPVDTLEISGPDGGPIQVEAGSADEKSLFERARDLMFKKLNEERADTGLGERGTLEGN